MARPRTVARVHAAVLALAERGGPSALTMEGIAAEAGVGKQTLYRSWPSVHALLFDALAGDPGAPGESGGTPGAESAAPREAARASREPDGGLAILDLLRASVVEISTEPRASLLRSLAASIQTDEAIAQQFRTRLLDPQLAHIGRLLEDAGHAEPGRTTERLLAPIFYRWFMRLPPYGDEELRRLVETVLGR